MFDLEDASNDGTIDAREFAEVCSCYGTDKAECEQAFAKMSKVRTSSSFIRVGIGAFNLQLRNERRSFDLFDSSVLSSFPPPVCCLFVNICCAPTRSDLPWDSCRARRKLPESSLRCCGRSSSQRRKRARPEISFLAI